MKAGLAAIHIPNRLGEPMSIMTRLRRADEIELEKNLTDSVVVITGASSGIGRATALEFARRGATLALAARGEEGLADIERECRSLGVPAISQPTDVASETDMRDLADRVVAQFGRIDVWVNNAAVFIIGRFEDTPSPDFRRVIETDLIGTMNGVQAVLPYFRKLGAGVIINVSSIDSEVSQPYASAYVAAKFGVRGFSNSLRQELRGSGVHVCTVMPASVDTPIFQHSANFSGRAPKAMPPVYPPERVARVIVDLALRPRHEVYVGGAAAALGALHKVMPRAVERFIGWHTNRTLFRREAAPPSDGNLFRPSWPAGLTHGGWKKSRFKTALAAIGSVAVAIVLLKRRRARSIVGK